MVDENGQQPEAPTASVAIRQGGSKVDLAGIPMLFEVEKIEDPNLGRIIVHVYHTPIAAFRFAMLEDFAKGALAMIQEMHGVPKIEIAREIPREVPPSR